MILQINVNDEYDDINYYYHYNSKNIQDRKGSNIDDKDDEDSIDDYRNNSNTSICQRKQLKFTASI